MRLKLAAVRAGNRPQRPKYGGCSVTGAATIGVETWLSMAALAEGVSPDRMGSHSLRIGGASALYHATDNIEIVKRFGRWASGAFHGYLWDSDEQGWGVAEKMAKDEATIHF